MRHRFDGEAAILGMLPIVLLLLHGCGGGGGGGGGGTSGSASGALPGTAIGKAELPDVTLHASRLDAVVPGSACRIVLRSTPAVGTPAVAAVRARAGTAYSADAATVRFAAGASAGLHEGTVTLPDPLPASARVVVVVERADGSVLETGFDDFRLR